MYADVDYSSDTATDVPADGRKVLIRIVSHPALKRCVAKIWAYSLNEILGPDFGDISTPWL